MCDHFDTHSHHTFTNHIDLARRGERQIDDSAFDEWSAIGDANLDALSVGEVGYLKPGVEGKSAMRGRELFHVEDFAGGGASSIVRIAVPAGDSSLRPSDASRIRKWMRNARAGSSGASRAHC
jgi:hypothetical protein